MNLTTQLNAVSSTYLSLHFTTAPEVSLHGDGFVYFDAATHLAELPHSPLRVQNHFLRRLTLYPSDLRHVRLSLCLSDSVQVIYVVSVG